MTKSKEIQPGYKNTALGSLPEEWKIQSLKSCAEKIIGGGTPSKANASYWNGDIPWASVKDFTDFNPHKTQEFITQYGLDNSSTKLIPANTLITPTRMALGKAVRFKCPVAINQDLKAIILKSAIDGDFFHLSFNLLKPRIEKLGTGSTVMGISLSDLKNLKIPIPPLPEQRAIATCLGTWDSALQKLDYLITAKRKLKKALMQQLLTGKKRLSGFDGEWSMKKLGILFDEIKERNDGEGHEPLSISAGKGFKSQKEKFDKVIAGTSLAKYIQINKGDFSYNKGNSKSYKMGCIYLLEDYETAVVPFVFISFRPTKKVDAHFYKQYFINHGLDRQLKRIITSGARGDGLLNVSKKEFFKLTVPYPTLKEQTAIAAVLSTADSEIDKLVAQREQLALQKKGLMQVLLTGRKRLKYEK